MTRTRVRWFRVGGLTLALVLALGSLAGRAGARAPAGPPASEPAVVHVVRPGETVWGIARSLVGAEGDPRPVVDALIQANHLRGGMVHPGERIVVPAP